MRVNDPGKVLGTRRELHRNHRLGDQLRSMGSDDVHAQDTVGLRVGDHLHETGGVAHTHRATVGHERKLTRFKCAPPIREGENRELLWEGLREDTISCVVSDHSPCAPHLKKSEPIRLKEYEISK